MAQRAGETEPDVGPHLCTWLVPGTSYSIGSSFMTIRSSGELIWRRKAFSAVDLPKAVHGVGLAPLVEGRAVGSRGVFCHF